MEKKQQKLIKSPYQLTRIQLLTAIRAVEIVFPKPDRDTREERMQQKRDQWLLDYAS